MIGPETFGNWNGQWSAQFCSEKANRLRCRTFPLRSFTPLRQSKRFLPPRRLEAVIPESSWEEHEKAKILEALQRTNGNITRAAQLLGMTFRTLQYRLEKFGIKRM